MTLSEKVSQWNNVIHSIVQSVEKMINATRFLHTILFSLEDCVMQQIKEKATIEFSIENQREQTNSENCEMALRNS